MQMFFKCVAEAVVEKGIHGLVEMVPGGTYLAGVADAAWKKYRERKKDAEQRAEIQEMAQAGIDEVRKAAVEAVKAAVPPTATGDDRLKLELYLSQVPGTVRQSLMRPEDATGETVPPGFSLNSSADVLKLLPARPPRFKPNDPVPGLPGWVLVRPLGTGGFGEVWLARNSHNTFDRGAVKFCHDQQAAGLRREANLIGRVKAAGSHPNIVQLLNANLECETPWLMFEYIQGGPSQSELGEWIRALQSRPTQERVQQALVALRQICPAVAHFHRLNIVHRDLKPSNILVDSIKKSVKITDFGIGAVTSTAAIREDEQGGLTSTGRLTCSLRGAHTPLYSSPQQRAGSDPDPRDDVHALGVIAYQLLTGQLTRGPGTDFRHDLQKAGVNAALIDLIGECAAHDPTRRPADAGELFRRVQEISLTPSQRPKDAKDVVSAHNDDLNDDLNPRRRNEDITPHDRKRGLGTLGMYLIAGVGLVLILSVVGGGGAWKFKTTDQLATTPGHGNQSEPPSGSITVPPTVVVRPVSGPVDPRPAPVPIPTLKIEPANPVVDIAISLAIRTVPNVVTASSALTMKVEPTNPVADIALATAMQLATTIATAVPMAAAVELESLVKASKAPDEAVRRKAVGGLATYLTNPDERLRRKSAAALADMGADAESATAALQDAVKDTDLDVRKLSRKALDNLEAAAAASKAAVNREAILTLAKDMKAKEPMKRIKALDQIAEFGPEANIIGEQLIDAMIDKVPAVQTAASAALEKVNPKVHPHVLTIMYGMKKHVAAIELGKLGADAAIAVPLLLYQNTQGWGDILGFDFLAIITKIAPQDKRVAAAVLAVIATPIVAARIGSPKFGASTKALALRVKALRLLNVIEADNAIKVKTLLAALVDGVGAVEVIAALEGLGKDASSALPVLKKLKTAPDDAIRNAAIRAVEKIE